MFVKYVMLKMLTACGMMHPIIYKRQKDRTMSNEAFFLAELKYLYTIVYDTWLVPSHLSLDIQPLNDLALTLFLSAGAQLAAGEWHRAHLKCSLALSAARKMSDLQKPSNVIPGRGEAKWMIFFKCTIKCAVKITLCVWLCLHGRNFGGIWLRLHFVLLYYSCFHTYKFISPACSFSA